MRYYYKSVLLICITILLLSSVSAKLPTGGESFSCISKEVILRDVREIARNVSRSNNYIVNEFDCTEFSQTLVKELKDQNINSYCVTGYVWDYNDNGKKWRKIQHTWVEVNIDGEKIGVEATGGYVIDKKEYKAEYNIIKRGVCA